jgi:signal peptidase I
LPGRFAQAVLRALWFGVIPALLAGLATKYLVPAGSSAVAAAGFFVLFSGLARYWRFSLPGGGYLSPLPAPFADALHDDADRLRAYAAAAAIHRSLCAGRLRRRLRASLSSEQDATLTGHLDALWKAFANGDDAAVREHRGALEELAAPWLASQRRREALGVVAAVAIAAGATLLVRTYVVEPYAVLSPSMVPTLEPGDLVAGNKLAYGVGGPASSLAVVPARGDVVVFRSADVPIAERSNLPPVLVKRVIGLPGDRIAMRGGLPIINGWRVPSCDAGDYLYVLPDGEGGAVTGHLRVEFLEQRAYLTVHGPAVTAFRETYEVKPGEVFVLGDNRNNSLDSRAWNDGHGAGVQLTAIDARAEWFLAGIRADGRIDASGSLRTLEKLALRVRPQAADMQALEQGIARCLETAPKETTPPPPGAGPESSPGAATVGGTP